MTEPADLALQHLALRLRPINRALRAAVERQTKQAARLIRPDVTPLCVTADQVNTLLADMDSLLDGASVVGTPVSLTAKELADQETLCSKAAALNRHLPLENLSESLTLSPFEEEAILLCAAPELDRSYERIYAYTLDDLNRRFPCVEILCSLTAGSLHEYTARRHDLSRFGKLRRTGILQAFGEPANELHQELRLAPGVFEFLTGNGGDLVRHFRDPAEISVPAQAKIPPGVDEHEIQRLAEGVREGWLTAIGIWGNHHSAVSDLPLVVASLVGKPIRRCLFNGLSPSDSVASLQDATRTASVLDSLLWLESDLLSEAGAELLSSSIADCLASSKLTLIISGTRPWRPTAILEGRVYAEIELETPDYSTRQKLWNDTIPEAESKELENFAARYRLDASQIRAAARMGRIRARLASNGHPAVLGDYLEAACATVSRKISLRFATVVRPKRGPNDLILSPAIHEQVLEVAHFFRAWPKVGDEWGFGRLETGAGGVKALFTGDSGTGKTLAAEIIASQLKMPLLKIDLAQVVSKWVGETEKHLEGAFREAEDSHAVLFFDEADALFGRRGDVQHGVDRYANLEVSYLLQRLEDYTGLVILASNLKDNIDVAFTRRFHIIIHFPRPDITERLRIWQIAFPPNAPLEDRNDLEALAKLDLTGAGIVGAARTAALLAAAEGSTKITKQHIVIAIQRQYRREARVIMPSELSSYADYLPEV